MRSPRKLGSDRELRVELARQHARQVFTALVQIGEFEDKKDPDSDYYSPAVIARWELLRHGLDKNFPLSDQTREFLLECLHREWLDKRRTRPRTREEGRNDNDNKIRDRWIAGTVNYIVDKSGLDATRCQESRHNETNVSACRIVAEVLRLREFLGNRAPAERTVENIWRKCRKDKTAIDVPGFFKGIYRLAELAPELLPSSAIRTLAQLAEQFDVHPNQITT
jgi:hypothetical protein